jgi:hypothetical protein
MSNIPLLAEEGWTRHQQKYREATLFLLRSGRGGQTGAPQDFAELTTPSAPIRSLRVFSLFAQPPLLCEEGNVAANPATESAVFKLTHSAVILAPDFGL